MRRRRQIIIILLCVSLLFSMGCTMGESSEDTEKEDKIKIVTTAFPPYDFARQLVGDYGEIQMLLKPGSEAHNYEPTPQDMLAIQQCDFFLYIGGEAEDWVEQVLDGVDNPDMQVLALMDCVEGLEEEVVEGMYVRDGSTHDHAHEEEITQEEAAHGEEYTQEEALQEEEDAHAEATHEEEATHGEEDAQAEITHEEEDAHNEDTHGHGELDEHVWTSPVNVMEISRQITECLIAAMPEHADEFRQRLGVYEEQLVQLDARFQEIVQQGKRQTLVFGDRFPFRYFAEAYGLSYYAAFPGCSSESEPSAATMIYLVDKIRQEQIPVVFTLALSNHKIADTLCQETGAKQLILYDCHNISKEDFQAGETYISLMKNNAESIREALN